MIRINPNHQAFPDCQVLNLCQVILIKKEFRNVIWHFSFFLLSKMIHLRDMHSASLKKKKNLLTYTGLQICVTFATFYWNSQAWKK